MTTAYNFERDLLFKCRDRRLNRIVLPLADGTIQLPGTSRYESVSYLIFELAKGDIRAEVESWKSFDIAWVLRSLHHTANGLSQLHSAGIAHQDLKPSNVLVYPSEGSKIADLGRASYIHKSSSVDSFQIPGDYGYAPPEQWYGWHHSQDFNERYVADLYHLGSLLYFYFAKVSATSAIRTKIIRRQPSFTKTIFTQDLPYLQQAFNETLEDLEAIIKPLAGALTSEMIMIAKQLCQPDPRMRGDPNAHTPGRSQHDVQAYISRFDRLATKAEMRIL